MSEILTQKRCTKCGEWKDRSEFRKNRTRKDGLDSWCKGCASEHDKNYPADKEYQRAYYRANKATLIEKNKQYAEKNKEKLVAYKSQWYQEHLDISKERAAKSRLRNPATPEQNRRATLKKRYGISPEDYDHMYTGQGGCCAICGEYRERLHVDHNHKTKTVRSLLCENCNRALGMVKEDTSLLEKAIEYLKRWSK
jgi:hypothetical protein